MKRKEPNLEDGAAHPSEESRATAALYALGALPPPAAREFEAHLASGCKPCALDARDFQEVAGALARAAGEEGPAPPATLQARLLERLEAAKKGSGGGVRQPEGAGVAPGVQVWKAWTPIEPPSTLGPLAGLEIARASERAWEETAVPGVSVRPLHVDPVREYVTMLVRMEPGSSYPRHIHAGGEECYVLEGDLRVGGEILRAGDYQYAAGGSEHGLQSTEGGCLLLIVSSQRDELV